MGAGGAAGGTERVQLSAEYWLSVETRAWSIGDTAGPPASHSGSGLAYRGRSESSFGRSRLM
jgi:hypothetical protein